MASLDDVRRIALSLPETTEAEHFGAAAFKVSRKVFAVLREPGRVTLKFDPEDQFNLMAGHPAAIERVPGTGVRTGRAGRDGWTMVAYGQFEEADLATFLKLAWSDV
ncbi:MAG: MmcQ/YjbR family DNA-binding protein, partial [Phenylobacterium sp.]